MPFHPGCRGAVSKRNLSPMAYRQEIQNLVRTQLKFKDFNKCVNSLRLNEKKIMKRRIQSLR